MATKKKTKSKRVATRPPDNGLNRESIVATALRLIDKHGLEEFSLRSVAKSLGVYPTAVYWYVNSKEKLLAEAIALAFRPEEPPDPTSDWREDIRKIFYRWRQAIRRHPNIAPAVASQLTSNTDVQFELVERILDDLSRAGFKGKALVGAYNAIIASLVGFVAQEFAALPRDDFPGFQAFMKDRLLSVDSRVYPVLSANVPMLANHAFILRWQNGVEVPLDDSFDFYIDLLIGGLSVALEGSRS